MFIGLVACDICADGDNLRPWFEAFRGKQGLSLRLEGEHFPRQLVSPEVPDLPHQVVTSADGRFRLAGIGRDRLVTVRISGPTIATQDLSVLTRPGRPIEVPEATFLDGKPASVTTYYGATFRHVAAPARPITGIVRDGSQPGIVALGTILSLVALVMDFVFMTGGITYLMTSLRGY